MLGKTDLNSNTGSSLLIYLLQPGGFQGKSKKQIQNLKFSTLEKIYTDVVERGNLIHYGTLEIVLARLADGRPIRFWPCGENITFTKRFPTPEIGGEMKTKGAKLAVKCPCHMVTGLKCDREELDALLLYLMLKQMSPLYPFANYTDCGHSWPKPSHGFQEHVSPDLKKVIQSLGVVSFSKEHMFEGKIILGGREYKYAELAPGLMAVPGLRTASGFFDGLDVWMNFLLHEREKILKQTQNYGQSLVLGPKTAKHSFMRFV